MESKPFVFRRYKESDADILYEEYSDYCQANIQPYFSGMRVDIEKKVFMKEIEKFSQKQHRPSIVANVNGVPVGVYHIVYRHANQYYELMLHLWNDKHLIESVLKEIIDQALHRDCPNSSLLVEIPGYAPELKQAADNLGLDLAGMIPNYLRHGENLFYKYTYVITSKKWHSNN